MANYTKLIAAMQAVIKENGNNEITGQLLQDTLTAMIEALKRHRLYAGIATPTTVPPVADENVFYLAASSGEYTDFDSSIVVVSGEIAIIYNTDAGWIKQRLILISGGGGGSGYLPDMATIDLDNDNLLRVKPNSITNVQIEASIMALINGAAQTSDVADLLADIYTKSDADGLFALITDLENFYTKAQSDMRFLQEVTKPMIEAVFTGNITSHTHNSITERISDLADSIGKGVLTVKKNALDVGTTFSANAITNVSLDLGLGTAASESKDNFELVARKDLAIPQTPIAGHYPTTLAIKTYVDSMIGGAPAQLFFYSFDYGQFTGGVPLISGETIGDELYNFDDGKNYRWNGSTWEDVSSELSKVPVDGSIAIIQRRFVDGSFAGSPGTAIHEYFGGVSTWFPFPQTVLTPDEVTIELNGSGQLQVKANSITSAHIQSQIMTLINGAAQAEAVALEFANRYTKTEANARFLQSITKQMIEDVLTGLITTHSHDTYTKSQADARFLQSITRAMVEAVLTGNVTTHSHNSYLTAITKTMVENVLTGNVTSHSHSAYLTEITKALVEAVFTGNITTHTHNYLPTTYQPILDFVGQQSAASLTNLAVTKKNVTLTTNANQTLSITSVVVKNEAFVVRVNATANIKITVPASGANYVNLIGDTSFDVANGKTAIMTIHQDSSDNKYIISQLTEE